MVYKLLSFLMIFLIISLTPVSAVVIHESQDVTVNTSSNKMFQDGVRSLDNKKTLNNMEMEITILQQYSTSLKAGGNNIISCSKDYGWRIWKWPEITLNIIKTLFNIAKTGNDAVVMVNKLNNEVQNIETHLKVDSDSYINNVDNPSCEEDSCSMAEELTKCSNTTFISKNINASELREGDIVQYLSEGKYPRYLAVEGIKIKNDTTNTRNLLGYTPPDIAFLTLKGTGDKLVEVPRMGECIILLPTDKVNTEDTLQNTVQIQQNNIENTKNQADQLKTKSERINTALKVFTWVTVISGGTAVFLLVLAAISFPFPPISAPIMVAASSSTAIFSISGVVTLSLDIAYDNVKSKANRLKGDAIINEYDLNTYIKIEKKNETFMNVTTFDGIPIIKQPPIDDWKELQFVLVTGPEHGDLLPGPGLQFLYGPHEGYNGTDQFKFQYTDKNGKICNVNVNITVNPIPIFTIPVEGRL